MEVTFGLAVALVGWLLVFVQLRGSGSSRLREPEGWLARRCQRGLARMGESALVNDLMARPAWSCVAAEVARLAGGMAPTREAGCALLLALAAAAAVALSLSAQSLVGAVVAAIALVAGVPLWASSLEHARRKELVQEMPAVFRTMAMALSSGETLSQAVEYLGAHTGGEAGGAFSRAALRLRCGSSVDEAMERLRGELDAPGVPLLSTALVISQRTGSPLKGLFEYSARLVERQGDFERLLQVKTAQVRLSVRIVSLMPVILVGVLSLLSPDFREGMMTPAGMGSLMLAALMDGAALVTIRRQLRGVL